MDEAEYTTEHNGYSIAVDKVGGGTVGKHYDGDWLVTVKGGDKVIYDNETFSSRQPLSHHEVALLATEFAGGF